MIPNEEHGDDELPLWKIDLIGFISVVFILAIMVAGYFVLRT